MLRRTNFYFLNYSGLFALFRFFDWNETTGASVSSSFRSFCHIFLPAPFRVLRRLVQGLRVKHRIGLSVCYRFGNRCANPLKSDKIAGFKCKFREYFAEITNKLCASRNLLYLCTVILILHKYDSRVQNQELLLVAG